MKKILALALISTAVLTSCEKAFEQPADWTSAAVIHAAPGTDTLHAFVDTGRYTATGVTYLNNSTYLPVLAGSHPVNIIKGTTFSGTKYVPTFNWNFERGKIYSFFVYDTVPAAGGTAKVLRLTDDLTLPTGTNTNVRFLHLAPNGPAVDVTLLRTSVTPNDSVTITNRSYIGATPNEASLSAFMPIPGGTYTAKVKAAGTQTVLLSSSVALNAGRIVTLFATGTAKGRPLAIGSFRHY